MANDKRFLVKNGLLTQNIQFTDSAEGNNQITATMFGTDTLSFSGNTGQLFSITDSQSGTIFAVNDISGVPSIGVDDTGEIRLAETFGYVLVGTDSDRDGNTLQVTGGITIGGYGEVIDSAGNWTGVAISGGGSVDSAQVLSIVTADGFTKVDSADVLSIVTADGFTKLDSTNVSSIITADVDAAFINALTIDADTLNSQAGTYYLDYTNFTNTPNVLDSAAVISTITADGFTKFDSTNASGLITTAIDNLIDAAPSALDTLNELAAALGDDANFSTTITNAIAALPDSAEVSAIITADVDKAFVDALNVDADTLDAQDGTYYLDYTNFTNTPNVLDSANVLAAVLADGFTKLDSTNVSSIITADVDAAFINALTIDADTLGSQAGSYYLDYTNFTNTPNILDSANVTDLIDSAYINARVSATGGLDSADLTSGTLSNIVADSATFTSVNFISPNSSHTITATVTDSDTWKLIGTSGNELISIADSGSDATLFSVYSGDTEIFRVDDSAGSTRFAVYDDSANELFRVDDTTSGTIFTVYDRLGNIAISVDSDQNVNLNDSAGVTKFANHAISSQTATTTATSQTAIATFNFTSYKGADASVIAIDSDKTHMSKFSIIHNGTTASASEYGIIYSDSALATYAVDMDSNNVRLLATPSSTNSTTFNIALTLMDA